MAEAARRTWPALIEAMLEAVCLVEPEGLRIVAANGAAGRLMGLAAVGASRPRHAGDRADARRRGFWQHVADTGGCASILSDSFVTRAGGQAVPVVRRVSRIEPAPGNALYVVALLDRSEQMRIERRPRSTAELAATLESIADGVLVVDLAGHISNFNRASRRSGACPTRCSLLRADDEVLDWMRHAGRRSGVLHAPARRDRRRLRCCAPPTADLRSGAVLERVTLPQLSRGRPIGRVFSYRVVACRPAASLSQRRASPPEGRGPRPRCA